MVRPRDAHDAKPVWKVPKATVPCTFATQKWVEAVFRTIDTPLRTHRITLSYSNLLSVSTTSSSAMGVSLTRTSGGEAITVGNANWFNFATWGTYTLGPNIRNDGAPHDSTRSPIRSAVVWLRPSFKAGRLRATWLDEPWRGGKSSFSSARAGPCFDSSPWGIGRSTQRSKCPIPELAEVLEVAQLEWGSVHRRRSPRARRRSLRLLPIGALRAAANSADSGMNPDELQSDAFVAKLHVLRDLFLTAAEQDVVNRALAVVDRLGPHARHAGNRRQSLTIVHWRSGVPQQVAAYGLLARLREPEGLLSESWARLMTKYLLVIVLPTEMLRLGRDVPLPNPTEPMFPFPLMDLSLPTMDDYKPRRTERRCGCQIVGP